MSELSMKTPKEGGEKWKKKTQSLSEEQRGDREDHHSVERGRSVLPFQVQITKAETDRVAGGNGLLQ